MAAIDANVFAAHTEIDIGFLRNGDAANVVRTARASSIPPKHHYSGIRWNNALDGNAANRVHPCPTAVILEAQIRSAFHRLVEAEVVDAREAHAAAAAPAVAGAAAGAAFDAGAARATARANATSRIEAIGIGATHTALVCSYHILEADLRPVEVANPVVTMVAPAGAADQAAFLNLDRTLAKGWGIALASGHNGQNITDAERTVLDMAPLTADEAELAYAALAMAQVAPVRAGAQLFTDGHHYLSDADSSQRHRAIEREVISGVGTEARNLWRANIMVLRAVIWHAGIHPVMENLLLDFAEDPDMPARLDATGLGSMSVGLPAQEDLFRRANSYTAVYNQVLQTATAHGHTLSLAEMTATVNALAALPRRGGLPAARPALPGLPAAPWPPGCDTRAKALQLFLVPALDKAEPVAAWMFGFYKEVCSRSGIRASSVEGSLLRSYSLKRAVANYLSQAGAAQEMYSARARYIRAQAEEGNLETYTGNA
jgi:hypothetical protein